MKIKACSVLIACAVFACQPRSEKQYPAPPEAVAAHREEQHDNIYAPGFGEFMTRVQLHHGKLYFAGKNGNWALAEFSLHEIAEAIADIEKFCTERTEVKSLHLMQPALDSVAAAIGRKDAGRFQAGYEMLTAGCNSCHKQTQHGFIVITAPEIPPVTNQQFGIK